MKSRIAAGAVIVCMTLDGCSSRPRDFTPIPAPVTASNADFTAAYETCRQLLVAGKLDSTGRKSSLGAGAAAGAATAAAGGTAAAMAGGYAGVAAASATIVLLPFAILGGAWGMSRMKRARKEQAIKTAIQGCLAERGYQVAGWSKGLNKRVVVAPATAAR